MDIRTRLKQDLKTAMKERQMAAVKTIRNLLAEIDHAEAVEAADGPIPMSGRMPDVPRKELSETDIINILEREAADCQTALAEFAQHGRFDEVQRLEEVLAIIRRYVHKEMGMPRTIVRFLQDEEAHWVAELDCYHHQHVRHNPPMNNRPWVLTGAGRLSRLGQTLTCLKCGRLEWPEDLVAYQRTAEFTAQSYPAGLRQNHSTKKGVWGKISVLEGSLLYVLDEFDGRSFTVTPTAPGLIPPEAVHHIEVTEPVRFFVEFYRQS